MIRISMAATLVIISIALASAQETKKATQELKKSDPDSKKTDPADDAFRQFKEPQLAKELSVRFQSDQAARNELVEFQAKYKLFGKQELNKVDRQVAAHYKALVEKVQNEDKKNLLWLKEVIAKHGWPGKTLVGPTSSQSAWLLAQHADTDRKFQRTCLAKMEAMPKGEVEPANIAYLTDRILVGAGKKQKYGTQAVFKDGKMEAAPIEDEDKVDERRKSLGLEPLEKYLRSLEEMYINPQKKEPKGNDKKP